MGGTARPCCPVAELASSPTVLYQAGREAWVHFSFFKNNKIKKQRI